jgi:accessory colonization factor AcfC
VAVPPSAQWVLRMTKRAFLTILIGLTFVWGSAFQCDLAAQEKPLRIYGPQGPFAAMTECAEIFARTNGVKAEVLSGPGAKWITQAKEDADVIYEETEDRLTQLMSQRP